MVGFGDSTPPYVRRIRIWWTVQYRETSLGSFAALGPIVEEVLAGKEPEVRNAVTNMGILLKVIES